jgi:hypothetical protein
VSAARSEQRRVRAECDAAAAAAVAQCQDATREAVRCSARRRAVSRRLAAESDREPSLEDVRPDSAVKAPPRRGGDELDPFNL